MLIRPSRVQCAAGLVVVSLFASAAFANSGAQVRLDSYTAGSETTTNSLITNPGFESVDGSNNPTGWTYDFWFNPFLTAATPDAANLPSPNNTGSRSLQAKDISKDNDYGYGQSVTLAPNTDYVLSSYIWNSGVSGPAPANDLDAGDLAVVQLRDPANYNNTAGMCLEPTAFDNQSGARGYFVYKTFNSSQFNTGTLSATVTLEAIYDPRSEINGARPALSGQIDNIALTTLDQFSSQKWTATGGGSWGNNANWQNTQANAQDAIAYFGNSITAAATINLDAAKTVDAITFNSTNSYTLAGAGTLTLIHSESGMKGESVYLTVLQGNHTILSPILVGTGTFGATHDPVNRTIKLNVNNAASVLTINADINAFAQNVGTTVGSLTFVKNGAGRADLKNIRGAAIQVNTGTLRVLAGGGSLGTSRATGLTVASGSKLDLTDHSLVVDYSTTSPIADVQTLLSTAYASGAWTGSGLTSSSAQTAAATSTKTALALLEATDLYTSFPATFDGQQVDNTTVLVKYALLGDTNFDTKVNTLDFNNLAGNFGGSSKRWNSGDFNYSGTVDSTDFNLFVGNYGKTLVLSAPSLGAVVPEPATLGLLSIAGVMLTRRRRD